MAKEGYMTGNQLRQYLHISTRKLKFLMDNDYIPHENTGHPTHKYLVKIEDAEAFNKRQHTDKKNNAVQLTSSNLTTSFLYTFKKTLPETDVIYIFSRFSSLSDCPRNSNISFFSAPFLTSVEFILLIAETYSETLLMINPINYSCFYIIPCFLA